MPMLINTCIVLQMAGAVGQIVAAARRRREAADQAKVFLFFGLTYFK